MRLVRTVVCHTDSGWDTKFGARMQEVLGDKYEFQLISECKMKNILQMAEGHEFDLFIPLLNNFFFYNQMDPEYFVSKYKEYTDAPIISYYLFPRDITFAFKMHKLGIDRAFQGHMIQPGFHELYRAVDMALSGTLPKAVDPDLGTKEFHLQAGMEWERVWGSIGSAYESVIREYKLGLDLSSGEPDWTATFHFMLARAWVREAKDKGRWAKDGKYPETCKKWLVESNDAYMKAVEHYKEVLKIKSGNCKSLANIHFIYMDMGLKDLSKEFFLEYARHYKIKKDADWLPHFLKDSEEGLIQ